jgi:hypothetical protein
MNPEQFNHLIANLPQAQTLDLYRFGYAIQMLYNEPRRILAVRQQLHNGMVVRFFDVNDGSTRTGRVVAMRARDLTIDETDRRLRHTGVPYAALDPSNSSVNDGEIADAPAATKPAPKPSARGEFKVGDLVSFHDLDLRSVIGTNKRMNEKTATVKPENQSRRWRVPFVRAAPRLE